MVNLNLLLMEERCRNTKSAWRFASTEDGVMGLVAPERGKTASTTQLLNPVNLSWEMWEKDASWCSQFHSAHLHYPAHSRFFPKTLQLKSVLESWYTSHFQTHSSTTVVSSFMGRAICLDARPYALWWPWCTSNLCRPPFIRKSFLNGSHHGEPAPNYPHLAPAKAASEKKAPESH